MATGQVAATSDLEIGARRARSTILLGWMIGCMLAPAIAAGQVSQDWQQRQEQIQRVIHDVMPATVAVTDGVGFGSGVVVDSSGLVLTAGHVMTTGGRDYRVIFPNGRQARARPLGKNLNVDAGMVQIVEPGPWPHVPLGERRRLQQGDWCVGIGHPGGFELGRTPPVRVGRILDFTDHQIITDCALIGGDSGGPLFDLEGRLIGIHSSIGDSIAENRHVTVDTYQRHWSRLVSGQTWGRLPELGNESENRGSLGIVIERESSPPRIATVHAGAAAERAGLMDGDVIVAVAGRAVSDSPELIQLINQYRAGEAVDLEILRDGQRMEIEVTLERRR